MIIITNDDSRKRRRDVLNHVEDVDPEMENQEMNRVLERFRSGQMVLEGRRNIFHDDGGDGNGNGPPQKRTKRALWLGILGRCKRPRTGR